LPPKKEKEEVPQWLADYREVKTEVKKQPFSSVSES
jgi:hypothetical protein